MWMSVIFSCFQLVNAQIYLWQTQDDLSSSSYDCIRFHKLFFCRRPTDSFLLNRFDKFYSCDRTYGGVTHRFSDLRSKNVSIATIIHQWKSSLEQVEEYLRYLNNQSFLDGFICQCQQEQSFGKYCEYRLPMGNSLEETYRWQLNIKNDNPWEVQRLGNITCYQSLTCVNDGLCLDWREICDGVQNCMFGADEQNCDILELNICDQNEYRCMNGMCIPEDFFLDGERDCLDWTDELGTKKSQWCADTIVTTECDDHICLRTQWSCGDGQCIYNRLSFFKMVLFDKCLNRRDQYHMCELHAYLWMWTMPNGRCYGNEQYDDHSIKTISNDELCLYLLKCALSSGAEKSCPCDFGSDICFEVLFTQCYGATILYPGGAALAPFLSIYFVVNEDDLEYYGLINGTMKCRNNSIKANRLISSNELIYISYIIDEFFCGKSSVSHDRCFHPDESKDICHHWNPCTSKTRISDGYVDCRHQEDEIKQTAKEIEESCSRVRRHRFRCSEEQITCLNVIFLGDGDDHCQKSYDEFWLGTNRRLSEIQCNETLKYECSLLRRYVEHSSTSTTNHTDLFLPISFRSFCDTFWDFTSKYDENLDDCQKFWICAPDQWRCWTGQCIDLKWLNDSEWDCADGSDEIGNSHLAVQLIQIYQRKQIHFNRSDPLSCLNHNTSSFYCLSPVEQKFICLHPSQIGNYQIDCLGAIDERNTLHHCSSSSSMLGYHFFCVSSNTCIPFYYHCQPNYRCPNRNDDELWCDRSKIPIDCSETTDFICFTGECMKDRRCKGSYNCLSGEDEFMCDRSSLEDQHLVSYREKKRLTTRITSKYIRLSSFPPDAWIMEEDFHNDSSLIFVNSTVSNQSILTAYICNRGIGILSSNDSIVCFCPPQYYGEFCQYHTDRLLLLLHLNLSQSSYTYQINPTIVIKLLVLFLFDDQILMTHEFHVRPALDLFTITKKMIHFLYPRTAEFQQHRQKRFSNRSDIIHSHPYTIRIEAYETNIQEKLTLKAVWHYPIVFDYLPVFRFSKILHLTRIDQSYSHPCSLRSCSRNAQCYPLMNNKSNYICLCKPGFTGINCTVADEQCMKGYCASQSLCLPNSRANSTPYCLCPPNRYGHRCEIVHDYCQISPCLNDGSCYPSSQPNSVVCLCTKEYHGSRCQLKNARLHLSLVHQMLQHDGVIVQYFTVDLMSLNLILVHQQVFQQFPRSIEYFHRAKIIPEIVLAKVYRSLDDPSFDLYLLASSQNVTSIQGTTEISDTNRCASIEDITAVDTSLPIRYHRICIENRRILCFRDTIYLCICTNENTRVDCFGYDNQLDHCSKCSSGGRCLRGNHQYSNDFLCLCPMCYSGRQCQFNSKSFAFTLDQLLYTDLISTNQERTITFLLIFSLLGFLLAIPNNVFCYVTFRQSPCLRNGIGYYLLCLSILNQINLALFLMRLMHLMTNMIDGTAPTFLDEFFCRSLNYLMTCSNRLVYWFSSLIAIERAYMTIFINGQWLKQPHIARRLIAIVTVMILSIHCYELIFYTTFFDSDGIGRTICVFRYPTHSQTLWSTLHPSITMIDSLLPFTANLCSTFIISVIVIKNKMNTMKNKTTHHWRSRFRLALSVLRENKDLVMGPAIALLPQLFSLPLIIIAFVLHCQTLENSWLRYLLIVSYWASLIPQTTSFFLYITPSSFYSSEWRKTKMGRWLYSTMGWKSSSPTMTKFTASSRRY